jgi:Tfp pilus assembly protein PilF
MRRALLVLTVLLAGCVSAQDRVRAVARTELGIAYYKEGNTESALATLRDATDLDPDAWKAWNALAVAYIAKGENALAEKAFARAIRAAPEEGEIHVTRGAYYVRTGRLPEAEAEFRAALADLDYRNPAVALSNLSYALVLSGKAHDAVDVAREAVRRAPKLCEAHYNLGVALEARKDDLSAIEAYKEQARLCPEESAGARLRLGCIQVRIGMHDEGRALLEAVAAELPMTRMADEARACRNGATP